MDDALEREPGVFQLGPGLHVARDLGAQHGDLRLVARRLGERRGAVEVGLDGGERVVPLLGEHRIVAADDQVADAVVAEERRLDPGELGVALAVEDEGLHGVVHRPCGGDPRHRHPDREQGTGREGRDGEVPQAGRLRSAADRSGSPHGRGGSHGGDLIAHAA